jgi:hypothetical protein
MARFFSATEFNADGFLAWLKQQAHAKGLPADQPLPLGAYQWAICAIGQYLTVSGLGATSERAVLVAKAVKRALQAQGDADPEAPVRALREEMHQTVH